jgi:hypothetical protein
VGDNRSVVTKKKTSTTLRGPTRRRRGRPSSGGVGSRRRAPRRNRAPLKTGAPRALAPSSDRPHTPTFCFHIPSRPGARPRSKTAPVPELQTRGRKPQPTTQPRE